MADNTERSITPNSAPADFVAGYTECALWSSLGPDGSPLDESFELSDICPDTLAEMVADCDEFCEAWGHVMAETEGSDSQHGHDFWLTRNGHGAGFWDRGYGKAGETLSKWAKAAGSYDLWPTDAGQIVGN